MAPVPEPEPKVKSKAELVKLTMDHIKTISAQQLQIAKEQARLGKQQARLSTQLGELNKLLEFLLKEAAEDPMNMDDDSGYRPDKRDIDGLTFEVGETVEATNSKKGFTGREEFYGRILKFTEKRVVLKLVQSGEETFRSLKNIKKIA